MGETRDDDTATEVKSGDPVEGTASGTRVEGNPSHTVLQESKSTSTTASKEEDKSDEIVLERKIFRERVIRAFRRPPFTVFPDFVDDEEVEHLLKIAEGRWFPSKTGRSNHIDADFNVHSNAESAIRTSCSVFLECRETPIVERVENRVACVAGVTRDYVETLAMVKYQPGEFFKEHHDGGFRPKTLFIYLNEIPQGEGGETVFPRLGMSIQPKKGLAIMWDNVEEVEVDDEVNDHDEETGDKESTHKPKKKITRANMDMIHMGNPPLNTVKYGINCFINKEPMRVIVANEKTTAEG